MESAIQRTVRSDLIVVFPPVFDQHLGLKERGKDFYVEKLVPQLPVRRFNCPEWYSI